MLNVSLLTQDATILGAAVYSADAESGAAAADATTSTGTEPVASGSLLATLGPSLLLPIALLAAMYFLLFRPQRKQEKAAEQMRANLQVGDRVVTVGGIIGIVVSVKDDTVQIESGSDRNKLRIKTVAVSENLTAHEEIEKAKLNKANLQKPAAKKKKDAQE